MFIYMHTEVIVGVNKYRLADAPPIEVLSIDNKAVREAQVTEMCSPIGEGVKADEVGLSIWLL